MQLTRSTRGFREVTLPPWLHALEQGDLPVRENGPRLINANRTTLVWSDALDADTRAVFKIYRHRGSVDFWREKRTRFRVEREYRSLVRLHHSAIPCCEPIFWSWGSCKDYGRYEILATREVSNATTVAALMQLPECRKTDRKLVPLFTLLARMHEAGFHHGALLSRNILATEGETGTIAYHIIDVPKTIAFPFSIVGTRMAWVDLLDLIRDLEWQGGARDFSPLLAHYGFNEKSTSEFMRSLARYEPSRHTRNRHQFEAISRHAIASAFCQSESQVAVSDSEPAFEVSKRDTGRNATRTVGS